MSKDRYSTTDSSATLGISGEPKSLLRRTGALLYAIPAGIYAGAAWVFNTAANVANQYTVQGTVSLPVGGSQTIDNGSCTVSYVGSGANGTYEFHLSQAAQSFGSAVNQFFNLSSGGTYNADPSGANSQVCSDFIKLHLNSVQNGVANMTVLMHPAGETGMIAMAGAGAVIAGTIIAYKIRTWRRGD